MASQAYYEGDWWVAVEDTSAGESPGTHPDKWARLTIPAAFERYVTQAAFTQLLPQTGQNDKRRQEQKIADELLMETFAMEAQNHECDVDRRAEVLSR